jgi:hypothetical protein
MTEQRLTMLLLMLPDRRMVWQRRTNDAPDAPGKLGNFVDGLKITKLLMNVLSVKL